MSGGELMELMRRERDEALARAQAAGTERDGAVRRAREALEDKARVVGELARWRAVGADLFTDLTAIVNEANANRPEQIVSRALVARRRLEEVR